MAPTGPKYDRDLTKERLDVAYGLGLTDEEIITITGAGLATLRKAKRAARGFKPVELERLNALIATRSNTVPTPPQQQAFDFESVTPIETAPDSPFDLRVLKVTNEQVWMVEVRPKVSNQSQPAVTGVTDLTDDEAADIYGGINPT